MKYSVVEFIIPELHLVDISWKKKLLYMEPINYSDEMLERNIDMKVKFPFPARFFGFDFSEVDFTEETVIYKEGLPYKRMLDIDVGQYLFCTFNEEDGEWNYDHAENIPQIQDVIRAIEVGEPFSTHMLKGLILGEKDELCTVQMIDSPLKGNIFFINKLFLKTIESYESGKSFYIP